jgi:hypothetical protein
VIFGASYYIVYREGKARKALADRNAA